MPNAVCAICKTPLDLSDPNVVRGREKGVYYCAPASWQACEDRSLEVKKEAA